MPNLLKNEPISKGMRVSRALRIGLSVCTFKREQDEISISKVFYRKAQAGELVAFYVVNDLGLLVRHFPYWAALRQEAWFRSTYGTVTERCAVVSL